MALEFRKMRRLRAIPLLIGLVGAAAALSSASLFSGGARATFDDPDASPWPTLLLSYTMIVALTSPIVAAVLASRQTDIEHSGSGWNLAATSGRSRSSLCRAKLCALALLLAPAVTCQTLLVIGIGLLVGITAPLDPLPWLVYTGLVLLLDITFCALHIWLAARLENQLVSVGVGMIGAFLAAFSLLSPASVSRVIPWGYYAVISQAGQSGDAVVYLQAPYDWIVGFLILAAAAFSVGLHRLDRIGG
ncbi:ABC transporter permease [Rathayibacter tritici]|uniref:ABC transporter n=1 Tax=Rathayibacter tritici TaxID=33888 RepID=A0A160KV67_9MICO|nr:ABC transporter permease [Rathayibacter tritici]AND17577.1 ABC transporter [Rathayibacter tritici]